MKRRAFLMMTVAGWEMVKEGKGQRDRSLREREKALEPLLRDLEAQRHLYFNVPREDGRFLNFLVKATGAKRVLEVGTSNGYSALWICLALEETQGHLTTIEILPERVQLARENLGKAKLSHRVTFLEGDAHKIVPTLKGPFDLVFLDADKGREKDYFRYLYPQKLPPGSLLVVHNAIRFYEVMRPYLKMISRHPEFDTLIVSVTREDGFAVSYRRRKV